MNDMDVLKKSIEDLLVFRNNAMSESLKRSAKALDDFNGDLSNGKFSHNIYDVFEADVAGVAEEAEYIKKVYDNLGVLDKYSLMGVQ